MACRIAEELDYSITGTKSRFSVSHVAFTAREFLELVSKDWPPGTVLIFDDAGLGAFSREAMLEAVRDIAKIFMSIRYRRWIVVLTLPGIGMLDKIVRELLNCYMKPVALDRERKMAQVKVRWVSMNEYSGDIYFPRPTQIIPVHHPYGIETQETKFIDTVWFPAPNRALADEVDRKKDISLTEWRNKIAQRIIDKETSKDKKNLAKNILDEIIANPERLRGLNSRGVVAVVPEKVMDAFNCTEYLAVRLAAMANRRLGELHAAGGLYKSENATNPPTAKE